MIGLFGIVGNQLSFEKKLRERAFLRMVENAEDNDFIVQNTFKKNGVTVGLTVRRGRENKDLALKQVERDIIIGFSGYGKFRGEKKLCWADEMISKIAWTFISNPLQAIENIEGCFQLLFVGEREFLIGSDRFGTKNCYYYEDGDTFIFGPDINGMLASNLVPKNKNIDGFVQVMVSGFFLNDETLVKGVERFPYASILTKNLINNSSCRIDHYWDIPKTEGDIKDVTPELLEEFDEKMKKAVGELIDLDERSAVPLSGGLDSRAIACYVAEKQKLETITYDMGEEVRFAKKVCRKLNGKFTCFSNEMLKGNNFKDALLHLIIEQKIHSVLNQYFHAPLFRDFFNERNDKNAIFDGVYMDILFSAPYTHRKFDFDEFVNTYARSISFVSGYFESLRKINIHELLNGKYEDLLKRGQYDDGVSRSQKFYISGRLRRYVFENPASKENYCYVFKPGLNYDLMDFGYSLNLPIRKGLLYQTLFKRFPTIEKIPYKDSYGNREKTLEEKVQEKYAKFRLFLSLGSMGKIKYFRHQLDFFCFREKEIDRYIKIVIDSGNTECLFTPEEVKAICRLVKRKQYFIDVFQRVLFVIQFYKRNGFLS